MAKILIIEPFFGGSHKQWAEGWQKHSRHQIKLLTLSAHHWKWRMHGAAVTLADRFLKMNFDPDWIVATDMLDFATFLSLTRKKSNGIATAIYFHENQLSYPWSPNDEDKNMQRDNHYMFINYTSALVADLCLFNSSYHKTSFLNSLPGFLKQFPDHNNIITIDNIVKKSQVLPLGLDLQSLDIENKSEKTNKTPAVLLWNHRWEYDKNPKAFFSALFELKDLKIKFRLIILGDKKKKYPPVFNEAIKRLKNEIVYCGYCENKTDYAYWLWQADIIPVTSFQDFFGGSIIEAVYCNTIPLLPCRLAYPEHFPYHPLFYYKNDSGFVEKLCVLIKKCNDENPVKTQKLVEKYDWKLLVKEYDSIFEI
jgi:glycosyltransferase involved in cell wall biosynthesis